MLEDASIIREKRKSIRITINREGKLIVYCPFGLPYKKIENILKAKENLLNKKLAETNRITDKYKKILNDENILLFGKEYVIVPTSKVKTTCFTDEYFLIPKKYSDTTRIKNCIKKSLKEIAERVIGKRFHDILQHYKTKYDVSRLVFATFKSKWGSCDNFNVIKLNWKLVMVKPELIDFVIFHELTHLLEFNHSKRFYLELEKVCPNWKSYRKELKEYAFVLNLY